MVQLFRWKDKGTNGQEKLKTYVDFSKKEQKIINDSPNPKVAEQKMMMMAHCEREASYIGAPKEGIFESSEITADMVRSNEGTLGSGTYFSGGADNRGRYSANCKTQIGYSHISDNHWDSIFNKKEEASDKKINLSKIPDSEINFESEKIKCNGLLKNLKSVWELIKNKFFN